MSGVPNRDEYAATAEFYDHIGPYRSRADVDFYVGLAREETGPVLELGCGTGRILLPTARAGCEITGLDTSASMLRACFEKLSAEAAETRERVTLLAADMRSFALNRRFKLITAPFRAFQHLLTVADQLACLQRVREHLDAGGRFVLDLFNPSLPYLVDDRFLELSEPEPEIVLPDGRRMVRRWRLTGRDPFAQVSQVELVHDITHPDGRHERQIHAFPMRYLFRFEAEHLLVRAGLEVESIYADYDRSPFGTKSPGELILVARRP